MFEEALSTAPPPEVAPPVGWEMAWAYDDPAGPIDAELLRELCTGGEAAPALFDIEQVPVGPELAARLAAFDPARAGADDLVEAAAVLERLEAWVAARKAAVHAELASRAEMRPDHTGYRSVNPVTNTALAVAGRCQVTCRQAENMVGHALQLVEDFPDTHAALSAGVIDLRRARVITDELGGQDPHVRRRVEAAVLPKAPQLDSVALRKLIKRLLHELAPVEAADRYELARDRRYVAVTPASDGMAHLEALLPASDAAALDTALNAAAADAKRADSAAGVPARTKDQRRADALADLAWAALAACADGAAGPLTHAPTATPGAPATAGDPAAYGASAGTAGSAGDPAAYRASAGTAGSAGDPAAYRASAGTAGDPAAYQASAAAAGSSGGPVRLASAGAAGSAGAAASTGDPTEQPSAGAAGSAEGSADRTAGRGAGPAVAVTSGGPPSRADAAGPPPPPTPSGTGATPPRRRPIAVHITVPFATALGLSDEPGELDGYGPIPAHVAKVLATEGVWTWLRTDGTGQLLDLGRTRYRPTKALADFIIARDKTCRAPGCHRPAITCDLDHIVPFAAGGATDPGGLQPLCATHHKIKHHGHWRVERHPDGTTVWISPTGHRYRKPPG